MEFLLKHFPFFFQLRVKKLRYAYGVTSKVRNSRDHYLLFDCDGIVNMHWFYERFKEPVVSYKTPHGGTHIIVFKRCSFPEAVNSLLRCPFIDRNYASIGLKREYWFLETQIPLFFKDLTYMRIERT